MESAKIPILLDLLQQKLQKFIKSTAEYRQQLSITIDKADLLSLVKILKDDPDLDFSQLMDLTAVDYLEQKRTPRFMVVYNFYSIKYGYRLRINCPMAEADLEIDSLSPLYLSADWYERECYDMYGVIFNNHPNLRRILLYDEFIGHPLRKDYPIEQEQPLLPLKKIVERHDYSISEKL